MTRQHAPISLALGHAVLAALALAACATTGESQDPRTPAVFEQWRAGHAQSVAAYQAYLRGQGVDGLVPPYQLMRSASDWQKCNAEPFAVPPEAQWHDAASVLQLLKALQSEAGLGSFEMHSGYRDAALNSCAGGAARSAHLRAFAADITPAAPGALAAICSFWHAHGQQWKMGLGQYPSGRIHVDTVGYRTWGPDFSSRTSPCAAKDAG